MEIAHDLQVLRRLPVLFALMGLAGCVVACADIPEQQLKQRSTRTPAYMLLTAPCTIPTNPSGLFRQIPGSETAQRYPVTLADGTILQLATTSGDLEIGPEFASVVDAARGLDRDKLARMGGTLKDYVLKHEGLRSGSTVMINRGNPSGLLECAPIGAVALTVNVPDGSSEPDASEVSIARLEGLLGQNPQGLPWAISTEICQQEQGLSVNVDAPESVCNGIGWVVGFLSAHAGEDMDSHTLYSQYVAETTPLLVETQLGTRVPYAIVNYDQFIQLRNKITRPLITLK